MKLEFRTVLTYDPIKHAEFQKFTDPSLTDPSEYESLEQILARCMRGDMSKVLNLSNEGFDDKATDEEIINAMSPQDMSDFDISDKTEITIKAQESLESLNKEKIKKGAKAPKTSVHEENKEPTDNGSEADGEGSAT